MLRKIKLLGTSAAACLVLSGLFPTLAAEGRIPVWTPTTITADGTYVVTRNINSGGGTPVIEIVGTGSEKVTLEMNGFTLLGGPGVPVILAKDLDTLVLRDGMLGGLGGPPGDGMHIEDVGRLVVEDVKVSGGGHGLLMLRVADFAVRRNFFVDNTGHGILLDGSGGPVPPTGTIEDNLVRNAADFGIFAFGGHAGVTVLRNRIDRTFGGSGILLDGGNSCIVSENTVEGAAGEGIHLSQMISCKVYNNDTSFNGANGILFEDTTDTLALDNVSGHNAGSGILTALGGSNHFDRNVLNFNECFGLALRSRENTFGRNTARLNIGGPTPFCPGGFADCTVANPPVSACWRDVAGPSSLGPPPGPGLLVPELCIADVGNTTFCDNLMPGPPTN